VLGFEDNSASSWTALGVYPLRKR